MLPLRWGGFYWPLPSGQVSWPHTLRVCSWTIAQNQIRHEDGPLPRELAAQGTPDPIFKTDCRKGKGPRGNTAPECRAQIPKKREIISGWAIVWDKPTLKREVMKSMSLLSMPTDIVPALELTTWVQLPAPHLPVWTH